MVSELKSCMYFKVTNGLLIWRQGGTLRLHNVHAVQSVETQLNFTKFWAMGNTQNLFLFGATQSLRMYYCLRVEDFAFALSFEVYWQNNEEICQKCSRVSNFRAHDIHFVGKNHLMWLTVCTHVQYVIWIWLANK